MAEAELQISPSVLSPCSSGRRSTSDSKSPEFEFWMVRNPTLPQPNLLSADELFADGVLLPLHLLELSPEDPPDLNQENLGSNQTAPEHGSSAEVSSRLDSFSTPTSFAASKRWKDIFKKSDSSKESEKGKKKEKKNGGGAGNNGNGIRAAELNINIWPFSRSRSAGNGGSRPRMVVASARKVSSAPCSRSNSRGESKSRKLPTSPNRGGVNLGRNSPVWHVRRGGSGRRATDPVINMVKNDENGIKKDTNKGRRERPTPPAAVSGGGEGTKAKALQLNVPMCIGYKHHLGCRSDEKVMVAVPTAAGGGGAGSESEEGVRGSNLFNIRNLFTKKVH